MPNHPNHAPTLRTITKPAEPTAEMPSVIALEQRDLEDFVARTSAIEYLNRERQQHLDEALRCETLAGFIQEDLTLWIERTYHVDVEGQQWHLDLQERRLVRVAPEPPKTPEP